MTTTHTKYIEMVDKENTNKGSLLPKKDKMSEEIQVKKTVLGESSQPKYIVDEPTSPEDTKLMNKKRENQQKNTTSFSLKLQYI